MMTGTSGRAALAFGNSSKAVHPRHIDVRQDEDQGRAPDVADALERRGSRLSELHHEAPGPHILSEPLPKQQLDVGLVVDDEDQHAHGLTSSFAPEVAERGRKILNSVYSPGLVSTSIEPRCCFTTMSWLRESPRPVPSPAGFVVKKGSNIFSLTSGGMPVPLSRIRISTRSPRSRVAAKRVGSYGAVARSFRFTAA